MRVSQAAWRTDVSCALLPLTMRSPFTTRLHIKGIALILMKHRIQGCHGAERLTGSGYARAVVAIRPSVDATRDALPSHARISAKVAACAKREENRL